MRAATDLSLRLRGHCDRVFNRCTRKLQNMELLTFNPLTNITVVAKSGRRLADHVAHVTSRVVQVFGCRTERQNIASEDNIKQHF